MRVLHCGNIVLSAFCLFLVLVLAILVLIRWPIVAVLFGIFLMMTLSTFSNAYFPFVCFLLKFSLSLWPFITRFFKLICGHSLFMKHYIYFINFFLFSLWFIFQMSITFHFDKVQYINIFSFIISALCAMKSLFTLRLCINILMCSFPKSFQFLIFTIIFIILINFYVCWEVRLKFIYIYLFKQHKLKRKIFLTLLNYLGAFVEN